MAMTKLAKAIKGFEACSLDKDVIPNCKDCPYSYEGSKCENNRTGERCCNELKEDALTILKEQEGQ